MDMDEKDTAAKEHVSKTGTLDSDGNTTIATHRYESRKPKWWYRQFGFGETKGQKRAFQEMQKTHCIRKPAYGKFLDWSCVFPSDLITKIGFEIGFGSGENILALAKRYHGSDTAIVGAEVYKAGTGKVCRRIQQGIQKNAYWIGYREYDEVYDPESAHFAGKHLSVENLNDENAWERITCNEDAHTPAYSNFRFYLGDAIRLLPYIPSASLHFILLTFPDPFPNPDESRWRILQEQTALEMHRVLNFGGKLILVTDHSGFFQWSLGVIENLNSNCHAKFKQVSEDTDRLEWLPAVSTYEAKGWLEGRTTHIQVWEKMNS